MNLDFLLDLPLITALVVVISTILIDTLLGVFKAIRENEFDVRELPRFLRTSVLPYIGGLIVIGLAAEYVGKPYILMFHTIAAAVFVKYIAEIKDKLHALFQVKLDSKR